MGIFFLQTVCHAGANRSKLFDRFTYKKDLYSQQSEGEGGRGFYACAVGPPKFIGNPGGSLRVFIRPFISSNF